MFGLAGYLIAFVTLLVGKAVNNGMAVYFQMPSSVKLWYCASFYYLCICATIGLDKFIGMMLALAY